LKNLKVKKIESSNETSFEILNRNNNKSLTQESIIFPKNEIPLQSTEVKNINNKVEQHDEKNSSSQKSIIQINLSHDKEKSKENFPKIEDKSTNLKKDESNNNKSDYSLSVAIGATIGSSILGFGIAKYGLKTNDKTGFLSGLVLGLVAGGFSYLFSKK